LRKIRCLGLIICQSQGKPVQRGIQFRNDAFYSEILHRNQRLSSLEIGRSLPSSTAAANVAWSPELTAFSAMKLIPEVGSEFGLAETIVTNALGLGGQMQNL
jgi:hypothetical protein